MRSSEFQYQNLNNKKTIVKKKMEFLTCFNKAELLLYAYRLD